MTVKSRWPLWRIDIKHLKALEVENNNLKKLLAIRAAGLLALY